MSEMGYSEECESEYRYTCHIVLRELVISGVSESYSNNSFATSVCPLDVASWNGVISLGPRM
jgi:hypothetical protein